MEVTCSYMQMMHEEIFDLLPNDIGPGSASNFIQALKLKDER